MEFLSFYVWSYCSWRTCSFFGGEIVNQFIHILIHTIHTCLTECMHLRYLSFIVILCVFQALGAFSVMQRAGHQSATHSQLMFLEGAVFIVVPVIAGVLEQCVRRFTTFSVVMMVMGVSIVLVMQKYDVIMKYTDRALIGNPKSSTAIGKSVEIIVLNNWYVRQFFTMMAVFLVFGGFVTFATSVLGSRV